MTMKRKHGCIVVTPKQTSSMEIYRHVECRFDRFVRQAAGGCQQPLHPGGVSRSLGCCRASEQQVQEGGSIPAVSEVWGRLVSALRLIMHRQLDVGSELEGVVCLTASMASSPAME